MIRSTSHRRWILVLLGLMTALSPFTLDMYLPAFPSIAKDFQTTSSQLAWTLSSNFIGIGLGQLFYGPLLDRFGRKKPLYAGLLIYIVASLGCMWSHTIISMIIWRFVVGFGGCVACVVAYAMVRDLFLPEERAKIFAITMLVMGASPLLAPSLGNIVTLWIGWQSIFAILAVIAGLLIIGSRWILPPTVEPDKMVRLHPWHIAKDYWIVIKTRAFYCEALTGASAFAALFAYVSGAPLLFLNFFHVSTTAFSLIFTIVAAGFILASQLNIWLLRHFSSQLILQRALIILLVLAVVFLGTILLHLLSLPVAIVLLFLILSTVSIAFSNATVLAMLPFGSNTGRASAFISFAQMLLGTIASMSVGAFSGTHIEPMAMIILGAACVALLIFHIGKKTEEY